ncbi:MAG: carbon-nitrogen hydrolase family protein, partial [Candidatus Pacebacteria bacterium]|nr:carbon-nitrogen hydrolase family protein [Candidatus Paceibacterota bacterium]
MLKDTKVVAIQAPIPLSKDEGEAQIKRLVAEAVKETVDIVGLSEDCVAPLKDIQAGYDPLRFLSQLAKENNVYLFGANVVKEPDGKLYNSAFFFNKQGKLLARHHKVVLTPPEAEDGLIPGNSLEIIDTEFGKIALMVCKDSFNRYAAWFFDKFHQQNV